MAENDIHIDLVNIKGESLDAAHGKSIQLEDFSFSVRTPLDVATNLPSGKRHWSPLTIRKRTDAATPILIKAVVEGTVIDSGKLIVRKAGGSSQQEYLVIELTNVAISSYVVSIPAGELPVETAELAFSKIQVTYKTQSATGQVGGGIQMSDVISEPPKRD